MRSPDDAEIAEASVTRCDGSGGGGRKGRGGSRQAPALRPAIIQ